MDSTSAPLNEEREQAVAIIFEIERFPFEEVAVRAFARAWIRTIESELCVAYTTCELI